MTWTQRYTAAARSTETDEAQAAEAIPEDATQEQRQEAALRRAVTRILGSGAVGAPAGEYAVAIAGHAGADYHGIVRGTPDSLTIRVGQPKVKAPAEVEAAEEQDAPRVAKKAKARSRR